MLPSQNFRQIILSTCVLVTALLTISGQARAALIVTPSADPSTLLGALVPNAAQFGSISASYTYGDPSQVGTYTGFTSLPVTQTDGVVLSSGLAAQTTAAFQSNGSSPSTALPTTATSGGSTPEINAYAPTHVTNWSSSHDTAKLTLSFTLTAASAIQFSFAFGSAEYPVFVSQFTDAFYAFLDGSQVSFDSAGNPVQVGASFASTLTTADTNTAFSSPHGLIAGLTTTSATLAAGAHTISFEVADTNDQVLDSAVFLTDFTTGSNAGGPTTGPGGGGNGTTIPEPASMGLMLFGLAALGWVRRRH